MSNPLALVTVTFPHPIAGSELMAAVKELSDSGRRNGPYYEEEQSFDDGDIFTIGQSSECPYEHLLVVPSQEEIGIRLGQTYEQVKVMSHKWPVLVTLQVGYDDSDVINSVRDFAQKLEQRFANPSEQTTESSV